MSPRVGWDKNSPYWKAKADKAMTMRFNGVPVGGLDRDELLIAFGTLVEELEMERKMRDSWADIAMARRT